MKTKTILSSLFALIFLLVIVPPLEAGAYRTLSTGASRDARGAHKDFSLKLVFAERGGALAGDVQVWVFDAKGTEVFTTHSTGPWLFIALPEGDYRIVAGRKNRRRKGRQAAAEITLSSGRQKQIFLTF